MPAHSHQGSTAAQAVASAARRGPADFAVEAERRAPCPALPIGASRLEHADAVRVAQHGHRVRIRRADEQIAVRRVDHHPRH